ERKSTAFKLFIQHTGYIDPLRNFFAMEGMLHERTSFGFHFQAEKPRIILAFGLKFIIAETNLQSKIFHLRPFDRFSYLFLISVHQNLLASFSIYPQSVFLPPSDRQLNRGILQQ